ncbi:Pyridoxamine 5'-phosphate oxidase [Metschnikowia aff. pulcherrima]|uniref:Pyridoxamine 5'-phosphate oxidase n=1 Tax=Metschnikowia aff. pulcherrima TaxID=2163413 RepID=A0A4P6XX23_9ASCO|nr:Pyridoxamine 5'-phosphate oxidase [Metschnikowia aff. pulcherrima]
MSSELPDSVVNLLKSKHFVHLGTCLNNVPHVSLMNYTYYSQGNSHFIIISTPIETTKFRNLTSNPRVSLLVHDWITSKLTETGRRNSLYELLTNINKAETNSVSVMLDGEAAVVEKTDKAYALYKSLLLNSGFNDDVQASNYVTSDDNALVLITIKACKVTDADNNVQQY